jgi:hypothetical protein
MSADEALAFDDRDEMSRHLHSFEDRDGREFVGRGDDRAEDEGHRPRKARNARVRDRGDREGRCEHQADRKDPDSSGVSSHRVGRGGDCLPVEQGRQEDHEDEIRVEPNPRQSGDESQNEPTEHQGNRVREVDPPRELDERNGHEEEPDQDPDLGLCHRIFRCVHSPGRPVS